MTASAGHVAFGPSLLKVAISSARRGNCLSVPLLPKFTSASVLGSIQALTVGPVHIIGRQLDACHSRDERDESNTQKQMAWARHINTFGERAAKSMEDHVYSANESNATGTVLDMQTFCRVATASFGQACRNRSTDISSVLFPEKLTCGLLLARLWSQ